MLANKSSGLYTLHIHAMKTFNESTSRFYHLNSSGSRGVRIDADGNRETVLVNDGTCTKARAVCYWEICGNWSFPVVRIKGKRVAVYTDDCPPADGSAPVWVPYAVRYPGKAAA